MPRILHIDSSTHTCSVVLATNGALTALRESHDLGYAHSEKLTLYIEEVLTESGIAPTDLHAVCVAKGPGSYTGLRIGVSAAKGLCYALNIPLLSVDALQSLVHWTLQHLSEKEQAEISLIRPMIDARRMEVYTAAFDMRGNPISPIEAVIIDAFSFERELANGQVLFIGDGAEKCRTELDHPNARFNTSIMTSAQGMFALAELKLAEGKMEDVAYFEPFYLKDFVAGKAKAKT